jgi:hypothetical protein
MTLSASRVPGTRTIDVGVNGPEGYHKVTETVGHVKSFRESLDRIVEEIEAED